MQIVIHRSTVPGDYGPHEPPKLCPFCGCEPVRQKSFHQDGNETTGENGPYVEHWDVWCQGPCGIHLPEFMWNRRQGASSE